jgi:hypothetical protein
MSMTALILSLSMERHTELTAKYGRRAADRALFATAARLIAGEYRN